MSTVAERIIKKFKGGESEIAELLGCDISRVYRWTYPKNRGGTGGTIPQKRQVELLQKAPLKGVSLSPADFFDVQTNAVPKRKRVTQ